MGTGRSSFAAWGWLLLLGGTAAAHAEGPGLRADSEPWPKLQARVSLALGAPAYATLSLSSAATGLQGARILGDYYFTGGNSPSGAYSGRFRATSGWLLGSSGLSLSQPAVPQAGPALSVSQLTLSPRGADASPDSGAAAYLGVGYTGLSPKGGWGFTADVGLLATGGSGLRAGRPALSDAGWREFRLTPVVQVGVSYSF